MWGLQAFSEPKKGVVRLLTRGGTYRQRRVLELFGMARNMLTEHRRESVKRPVQRRGRLGMGRGSVRETLQWKNLAMKKERDNPPRLNHYLGGEPLPRRLVNSINLEQNLELIRHGYFLRGVGDGPFGRGPAWSLGGCNY